MNPAEVQSVCDAETKPTDDVENHDGNETESDRLIQEDSVSIDSSHFLQEGFENLMLD